MIVAMTRIRILGPAAALGATVRALQDVGVVHVVDAEASGNLVPVGASERRRRHLTRALARADAATDGLRALGAQVTERPEAPVPSEGRAARLVARVAGEVARLVEAERRLAAERDALRTYEPLFADLEAVLAAGARVSIFLLRLHAATEVGALREALVRAIGKEHELRSHVLASGELVVLLLVPAARSDAIERYLAEARLERAALPGGVDAAQVAHLRPRLAEVEVELAAVRAAAAAIAARFGAELARSRRSFHDALLVLEAEQRAVRSSRAFALEGWLPVRDRACVEEAVARAAGPTVTVSEVAREAWHGDAPVVLANPKLFAPFEALTSFLPLPRYGTVDPTPFVAVFFPMFFGVIVGDVGYGAVMALLAGGLWLASGGKKLLRDVAKIAGAVAAYAIAFGVFYGELFGDLGEHLGMRPLWFDRREAVLALLVLAISLGMVHLVVGLLVAAANRWRRDRREAIGRGLTAAMLLLVAVALLALVERVPAALLTPAVIAVLVTFALIVAIEGITALLDLVQIVGHVLSYARVMALGTASVMLAVVANQMSGAFGSLALGIAFALVFHLVNFAITLFSPTIHVMRLHYVEMFGTFFEPGGGPYQPLRHWSAAGG